MKNLMLLLAPFFEGRLLEALSQSHLWIALISFCLAASAIYAFNDSLDFQSDSLHPRKRRRPVAAGRITPRRARGTASVLAACALAAVFIGRLPAPAIGCCVLYLGIGALYSWRGRSLPILDMLLVAAGFLLRIAAGSFASQTGDLSIWLALCAFLMALLVSAGKRHSEIHTLGASGGGHRISLSSLGLEGTAILVWMSAVSLAAAYALYAFTADTRVAAELWPWVTTPVAFLVIALYLKAVFLDRDAERPHVLWFHSKAMLAGILGYFGAAAYLLYVP